MANTGNSATVTATPTVSEQLEAAWLSGEMPYSEACGWMEELEGSEEEY